MIRSVPDPLDAAESPAGRAKRLLAAIGFELPGRRAIDFAVRLRTPREGVSETSDVRIRRAMAAIEDGPVALVAENPELRDEPLRQDRRRGLGGGAGGECGGGGRRGGGAPENVA